MFEKKTKIICTISDINCEIDFIRRLYESGMNVARINSAHATLEGAQRVVDNIRSVSDKIAILVDTKGPEVRLTAMASAVGFVAKEGDSIEIHNGPDSLCNSQVLYTNCSSFVADVPAGSHILLDDGAIDLLVTDKDDTRLLCRIMNSGVIKGKKSVNVPNVHISLPALTEKDKTFVEWAIEADRLGAGEILLTSMDGDGTKAGYDLELTRAIAGQVSIPVIASGGAGTMEHFREAFTVGGADAALAASLFHFKEMEIRELKLFLSKKGIPVRI